ILMKLCAKWTDSSGVRNLGLLCAAFLIVLPAVSAGAVATAEYFEGVADRTMLHWASDALAQSLGYLAFLPLWIGLSGVQYHARRMAPPRYSVIAAALVGTAVIALAWNRFGAIGYLRPLLIIAPVLFLAAIAMRSGSAVLKGCIALVATVAFALSLNDRGPFVEADALLTALAVKLWILIAAVSAWLVALFVERHAAPSSVDSSREVRELAGRLIEAQERERSRIARDLHDDVNQRLASASIQLSALRRSADDKTRLGLDRLQNDLIELSEDVRQISHNLHPSLLRETGLKGALGSLCNAQRHRNGPSIDLHVENDDENLPDVVALCLYRAAQEALGNAVRHAAARHIDVRLQITGQRAELIVADDGRGFIGGGNRSRTRPHGLGLLSLEERAKLLEGTFRLDAAPGKGVRVCLSIPLQR
ncbi:MAG: histidine kinase, partial [Rhodanobacteraceae bacterium]